MKLESLRTYTARRLASLEAVAHRAASLAVNDFDRERLASFATIDLHNSTSEWIRRYYVSVSMNRAIRRNGRKITIGRKHQSSDDAILYAIRNVGSQNSAQKWIDSPSRFFEPNWGGTNVLPRLASILNFPDKNNITTSLSAARDMFKTLRVARNYYAHRNRRL